MNYGSEGWPPIPGATSTSVEWLDGFAALRNGTREVQVNSDGSIMLTSMSELEAPRFLTKDEARTEDLQRWFNWAHVKGDPWASTIRRWVHKDSGPAPSVKNWYPAPLNNWKMGKHLQGNTANESPQEWTGTIFEYTHFVDDEGRDGLVVMWHEGDDVRAGYRLPEVWMGDVDAFMSSQREGDPSQDVEVLERWNERFENGIIWAFDRLGLLARGNRQALPPSVKALMRRRPDLLSKARAS